MVKSAMEAMRWGGEERASVRSEPRSPALQTAQMGSFGKTGCGTVRKSEPTRGDMAGVARAAGCVVGGGLDRAGHGWAASVREQGWVGGRIEHRPYPIIACGLHKWFAQWGCPKRFAEAMDSVQNGIRLY